MINKRFLMFAVTGALVIATAGPAVAAVTMTQRLSALAGFTEPAADSFAAWNQARLNPDRWQEYQLDWSTDYCSGAPDRPFGFDFRLPCYRHDFGYRNYRLLADDLTAIGEPASLGEHKERIDAAFYADLRRVCDRYPAGPAPYPAGPGASQPVETALPRGPIGCEVLALLYYQAVQRFSTLDHRQLPSPLNASLKSHTSEKS